MSPDSVTPQHRAWVRRLAVGVGALVMLLGVAVLVVFLIGRPRVSLSSSSGALVQTRVGGAGAELAGVAATSAGRPVVLVRTVNGLVPADHMAQGQVVRVTASAVPPSWLRWLLGSGVSAERTVRTPVATPAAKVAVASSAGQIPVRFDTPVSLVEYQSPGASKRVVRLSRPTSVVGLTVSTQLAAGSLKVTAAPQQWERVAPQLTTVTWFAAPTGHEPVALAHPAPGTTTAASDGAITLTFAEPVAKILGATRPKLSPPVAGGWSEPAPNVLVFTPSGFGFGPSTAVTVAFDRPISVVGATTTTTARSTHYGFETAPASLLRLEQILAQLHYLPLNFAPAAGVKVPTTFAAEVATLSDPLAGRFSWRWASTPSTLKAQWTNGSSNVMVKGALMAFDSNQAGYDGYQLDDETTAQLANASTVEELLHAAVANQVDPAPYSYVYVTETIPETLTLWENGAVVLTSAANTGISEDPTATGTYPIYVRYTVNYMRGTNPNGTTYDDLVYWINYFNGGDAVHGFVRGSYGFPQSLGCVELPVPTAATVFSHLAIGDLVTVAG
jgi:lipoprotein-anchoring transpeptidase ErfK/SrfK